MSINTSVLLDFWFTSLDLSPSWFQSRMALWFGANPDLDSEIATRFGSWLSREPAGDLSARDKLAWVILWDQVPRNLWRGQAKMLSFDHRALEMVKSFTAPEVDSLHPMEQCFFWLVYQHQEDISAQEKQLAAFEKLLSNATPQMKPFLTIGARQARRHLEMIQRFGRFPHRNPMLGRQSTAEEQQFIDDPDYNFLLPVGPSVG